jgi:hypothetical protein
MGELVAPPERASYAAISVKSLRPASGEDRDIQLDVEASKLLRERVVLTVFEGRWGIRSTEGFRCRRDRASKARSQVDAVTKLIHLRREGPQRPVPDRQRVFQADERNEGVTEIVTIPDRVHTLTIDSGWQEAVDKALECVKRFTAVPVG